MKGQAGEQGGQTPPARRQNDQSGPVKRDFLGRPKKPSLWEGRNQLDYWMLCFGQLLLFMGFFSFFQFPLYIKSVGGGEVAIGVIMGGTSFLSTLLLPWITALVDKYERRMLMLQGAILLELGTLVAMTTWAPNAYMALVMVVRGLGFSLYLIASGAYVAQIIPTQLKAKYIGINFGFNQVAIGLGPWMAERIIYYVNYPFFFFMATAFVFSGMLLILTITTQPPAKNAPAQNPLQAFQSFFRAMMGGRLRSSFLAVLMLAGSLGALFNFTATYAKLIGISSGVFFLTYALSNAASRFMGAGLADRYNRTLVIIPNLAMMGTGILLFSITTTLWESVVAGLLIGIGFGLSNPAILAKMLDRSPPGEQSRTIGSFHFAYQLGLLSTPPIYGVIADNWGYAPMWWIAGSLSLISIGAYFLPEPAYDPKG